MVIDCTIFNSFALIDYYCTPQMPTFVFWCGSVSIQARDVY
jgi:hypothetical protein